MQFEGSNTKRMKPIPGKLAERVQMSNGATSLEFGSWMFGESRQLQISTSAA